MRRVETTIDSHVRVLLDNLPKERLQAYDAANINSRQYTGQHAIDEGLVDEHVYIPQPIAQNCNCKREGDQQEHQVDARDQNGKGKQA
jgi:hypothetical protein